MPDVSNSDQEIELQVIQLAHEMAQKSQLIMTTTVVIALIAMTAQLTGLLTQLLPLVSE